MDLSHILQTVQNRGNELLKCFSHERDFVPVFHLDARTHQAKIVVHYFDRKAERPIATQLVCNAPKKQAADSMSMLYQDAIKELK